MAELKKGVIGSVIKLIGWKIEVPGLGEFKCSGSGERSREIDGKVSIEHSEFLSSFTDLKISLAWCEDIEASKTSNTGCWIFISRKIKTGLVLITPRKIWRLYAEWH